jgi:hypothetical protein
MLLGVLKTTLLTFPFQTLCFRPFPNGGVGQVALFKGALQPFQDPQFKWIPEGTGFLDS